jgi:hypothetical protein
MLFNLTPTVVFRAMLALIGAMMALAVLGFALDHLATGLADDNDLLRLADLNHEESISNWYSSIALLFCGLLLVAIALTARMRHSRFSIRWAVLAAIFVFLAMDEVIQVHEIFGQLSVAVGDPTGYILWTVPYGLFAIAVLAAYVPWLRHLPRRTMRMVLAAGVIYVGGAIGLEAVGAALEHVPIALQLEVMVEEFCEMLGVAVFALALVEYLVDYAGEIVIGFGAVRAPIGRNGAGPLREHEAIGVHELAGAPVGRSSSARGD